MLKSITGHLMVISGRPNLSLELVILVIMVKNITFIVKTLNLTVEYVFQLEAYI